MREKNPHSKSVNLNWLNAKRSGEKVYTLAHCFSFKSLFFLVYLRRTSIIELRSEAFQGISRDLNHVWHRSVGRLDCVRHINANFLKN